MEHRAQKRARDKGFQKTVIKTGLSTFCKEPLLLELIEKAVQACSQVSWEASMLASFHVLRCLENKIPVEPIDQNFWTRCISSIANGTKGPPKTTSRCFRDSFDAYSLLRPPEYVPVSREPYMCHIFEGLRETMLVNFSTVFAETFKSRLCKWLRMHVMLQSHHETIKQPSVIKSVVTLLCSASTNEEGNVDVLHPRFTRLSHLTPEHIQWMQELVTSTRMQIGNHLPLSLETPEAVHSYLPFLYTILEDIQRHVDVDTADQKSISGIRTFSLLPQKKFRAPFLHISTTVLKALLQTLRGRKQKDNAKYDDVQRYVDYLLDCVDESQLWRECFCVEKMKGKKRFANSIKTDGLSVSVTVEMPIEGDPLPSKGTKRKQAKEKKEKDDVVSARKNVIDKCRQKLPDRCVGIDPGVRSPFTGVVYNKQAIETLTHQENTRFETFSWSAAEYYKRCGITSRTKQMDKWTSACPPVQQFNETVASSKTASSEAYALRISKVLESLPTLLDFYVKKRRVRRSRWYAYMQKQRAEEDMIETITATRNHKEQKKVLVAYGNAAMHNVRGTKPVVQKALRRKLMKRCMLIDVDEFRSSKLCCSCLRHMNGKTLESGKKSYGVRHCNNSACHRIYWNRDVNAAISILLRCIRFLLGQEEPREFLRSFVDVTHQHDA